MDPDSSNDQHQSRHANPDPDRFGDSGVPDSATSASGVYVSNPFQVFIDSFKRAFTVNFTTLLGLLGVFILTIIVVAAGLVTLFLYTGLAIQNQQLTGVGEVATVVFVVVAAAGVVLLVWGVILYAAWEKYALETTRERMISFGEAMRVGVKKGAGLLILNVLLVLIIAAGLAFFIVPGLFFLYWFIFAPFIYVDKDMGIIASMQESKRLVQGKLVELIGLLIASFILGLPGQVPLLGSLYGLIFAPVAQLAFSYRYISADTLDRTGRTKPETDAANTVLMWIAVAIIALTLLFIGAAAILSIILAA